MQTGGLDPRPWGSLIFSPRLRLEDATTLDIADHGYVAAARVEIGERELALISLQARTHEPLGTVRHIEEKLRSGKWARAFHPRARQTKLELELETVQA